MASLFYFSFKKVLLLHLIFVVFISILLCASSDTHHDRLQSNRFLGRRRMLELQEENLQQKKKSSNTNLSTKNQTKLIKTNSSSKNQTQLIKTNSSLKNQTKLLKASNSTKATLTGLSKSELKKLNSTSQLKKLNSSSSQLKKLNSTSKATNSTKSFSKKSSDLMKLSSSKNKTTKPTSTKQSQTLAVDSPVTPKPEKNQNTEQNSKQTKTQTKPIWLDQDDDDDLVKEFRDLPTKFQQTLLPDLEKISTTSKAYITKYNKEITKNFKPIVGKKYAPTIATLVSCAFILIPLLLVSLLFNRIKAYFSLQKILIFIQVYLSIYFSILCLSSLVTGLEPLRFFYATSQSTYVCIQVMQTLGYVLYLLLLLMYLILVFSTDCGLGSKMLGLAQIFVGFSVGLHYYVAVFHRMVLRQPPKTNWKIHGIYATCFLLICVCATAERRKKSYLEDSGEEGKKN